MGGQDTDAVSAHADGDGEGGCRVSGTRCNG
jgi:hypothetical protein